MRRESRVRGRKLKGYEGSWEYRSLAGSPNEYPWQSGKSVIRQNSRDRPLNMPLCRVKGAHKKGCQDITRDTVVRDWRLEPRRGSDPNEAMRIAMALDVSQDLGDSQTYWDEYHSGQWSGSDSTYGSYPCSEYGSEHEQENPPVDAPWDSDAHMGCYDAHMVDTAENDATVDHQLAKQTQGLPKLELAVDIDDDAADCKEKQGSKTPGEESSGQSVRGGPDCDLSQWPQLVAAVSSLTLEAFRATHLGEEPELVSEDSMSEAGSWVDVADLPYGPEEPHAKSELDRDAAEWQLL